MASAISREGRDGRSHHCRIRDLHDIRRCLSLLSGEERDYTRLFLGLWLLTIALGGLFLYGTATEWHRLIYEHGLTISTNLFGTTYYSLVGLHAFHVTAGLIMLSLVAIFGFIGHMGVGQSGRVAVLSMYWHFVDAVWVVVFTVVYVLGR